jgi:hypothetical protein
MTGYDEWPIGDDSTDPDWEWVEPLEGDASDLDDERHVPLPL